MKKNKKRIKILKILLIVLIALLAITSIAYVMADKYYNKMNIKPSVSQKRDKLEIDKILEKKEAPLSAEELKKIEEDKTYDFMEANLEPIQNKDDVFNILLIGTDERGDVKGARSDTMMLLSINDKNKEITLTSFMRDMYVSIPGYGRSKLNAAYAYGGPELLKNTLYKNFNVEVDKYVQVDFESFIELFDSIKGIEVEITEKERAEINRCIEEINYLKKRPWGTNNIAQSGKIVLKNGDQALSYARIRKVGNSDFDRTNRQRELLGKAFEKVKTMGILEINDLLNKSLPLVTTNLTKGECFSLAINLLKYKNYSTQSLRVPIDGSFSAGKAKRQQVIMVDFNKNIKFLKDSIYLKKKLEENTECVNNQQ